MSTASNLPVFTPAKGHSYIAQTSRNHLSDASVQATQSSEALTPMQLSSTPRHDTQDSTSTKESMASKLASHDEVQSARLLETSYDLLLRYGNEYMDENPLTGEPGSFKLSKTRESGLGALSNASQISNQPFKTSVPTRKPPPPQLQTSPPLEGAKKASPGSAKSPITPGTKRKKERRKSRPAGADEITTPKATTLQGAT